MASTNVNTEEQKQIIEITARGGIHQQLRLQKLLFRQFCEAKTNGTYDCSSALRI